MKKEDILNTLRSNFAIETFEKEARRFREKLNA